MKKFIYGQLDIKLGQFTQEELDVVLTKIESRTITELYEIHPYYGRQENLMTYFFNFAMPSITKLPLRNGKVISEPLRTTKA